jgi:hypothetical protein
MQPNKARGIKLYSVIDQTNQVCEIFLFTIANNNNSINYMQIKIYKIYTNQNPR